MSPTTRKWLLAATLTVAVLLAVFWQSVVFPLAPSFAFSYLTGRPLPPGVTVTGYASKMTDNLFKSSYYWRLEHDPTGFGKLQEGVAFYTYTDDVTGYVEAVRGALAPSLRIAEISSIKQSDGIGHRSQLILQHRNGLVSYYVLSTI